MGATPFVVTRVASFIDRQKAAMIVGYVDIELDDDYVTGGWDLSKAEVNPNLSTVYWYNIQPVVDGAGTPVAVTLVWDHANGKMKGYTGATGEQLASSYDSLDGITVRMRYEGI